MKAKCRPHSLHSLLKPKRHRIHRHLLPRPPLQTRVLPFRVHLVSKQIPIPRFRAHFVNRLRGRVTECQSAPIHRTQRDPNHQRPPRTLVLMIPQLAAPTFIGVGHWVAVHGARLGDRWEEVFGGPFRVLETCHRIHFPVHTLKTRWQCLRVHGPQRVCRICPRTQQELTILQLATWVVGRTQGNPFVNGDGFQIVDARLA